MDKLGDMTNAATLGFRMNKTLTSIRKVELLND